MIDNSAERQKLKSELEELARGHRVTAWSGASNVTIGHITIRDPEGRGLWIKNKNLAFEELYSGDQFMLVDFEGKVIVGESRPDSSAPLRHSEWPLHSEIYKARKDVNAIVHTHPFYATAFSAMKAEVLPLAHEGNFLYEKIAYYRRMPGLVNGVELGRELAEALGDKDVVLLQNHGVTAVGVDVPSAVMNGIFIERACQMQIVIFSTGVKWTVPEDMGGNVLHKPTHQIYDFWKYCNRMVDHAEESRPRGLN